MTRERRSRHRIAKAERTYQTRRRKADAVGHDFQGLSQDAQLLDHWERVYDDRLNDFDGPFLNQQLEEEGRMEA